MSKLARRSNKLLASVCCLGLAQYLSTSPSSLQFQACAQGQPVVPAPAGTTKPPSATELNKITERGKDLYEYDKACSQATDALLAAVKNSAGFKLFVAFPEHDIWHVAFGTMSDDGESFLIAYEVTLKPKTPADVKSYDIFKLDKSEFYRRGKALNACRAKMKSTGPLMNYAAIPSDASKTIYWVYQFPGTTEPGVYLLGGDVRYLVSISDNKILETRQMHRSVLPWPKRADIPTGTAITDGCHSAILEDEPEDTDVFHVLLRKPQVPEYIATANWIFRVDVDGSIRLVRAMKEASQQ